MATKRAVTVTLSNDLIEGVDRLRRSRSWSRSFIVNEAVRDFVRQAVKTPDDPLAHIPYDDEPVTARDARAIREGKAEIARGKFVPLEEIMKRHGVSRDRGRASRKSARPAVKAR